MRVLEVPLVFLPCSRPEDVLRGKEEKEPQVLGMKELEVTSGTEW